MLGKWTSLKAQQGARANTTVCHGSCCCTLRASRRRGSSLTLGRKGLLVNRRLRILFVCAMNKQRSVTAECLYRKDARLDVRSAGVRSEANRRVSEDDLRWADVVFVM